MLLPFFGFVVDVFNALAIEGVLIESMYADDLFMISETIMGLMSILIKREVLENKGLKVKLGKIKVMVSGSIIKDGLSKSKVDICEVCCFRVESNSVLSVQYGKWIRGRCPGVKMVTAMFSRNLKCWKFKANIRDALEQEEKLCDEVETVRVHISL